MLIVCVCVCVKKGRKKEMHVGNFVGKQLIWVGKQTDVLHVPAALTPPSFCPTPRTHLPHQSVQNHHTPTLITQLSLVHKYTRSSF